MEQSSGANEHGAVLAPVDFSPNSLPSVTWAARAAKAFGSELLILHVAHDPAEDPGAYLKALVKEESDPARMRLMDHRLAAGEVLEKFLAVLQQRQPDLMSAVRWQSRLVEGLPGPRILEVAEEIDASLIVVGSHGRTGLSGLIVGSKAEKVLDGATVPVTVVKNRSNWL